MECEHRGGMTNNGTISMAAYHLEAAEGTVGLRLRLGPTGLDEAVVPTLVGTLATGAIRALTSLRVRTTMPWMYIYPRNSPTWRQETDDYQSSCIDKCYIGAIHQ